MFGLDRLDYRGEPRPQSLIKRFMDEWVTEQRELNPHYRLQDTNCPLRDPGCVLIRMEEASPETRSYTFVTRGGGKANLRVRASYRNRVETTLVTPACAIHKSSFIEQELRLAMPYTGWDAHKRLAWYAAKHFLERNERLAQDTSNAEAIADLEAEAERIKARI